MMAGAVHPQPPHAGRSAALMLASLAVHGMLLWGLVHYSLRPMTGFALAQASDPVPIQVMVISTPRPTTAAVPLPVQPAVQPPAAAVPVAVPPPRVQTARPHAVTHTATPVEAPEQPQIPTAQTQAPVQAVATASTVATSVSSEKPHAAGTAIPAEKPVEAPLVQGHPDYAYNPLPDYPMALREQGLGGVVWLRVWVDSEGHPGEIKLAKGSGYRLLDESALRAVRGWRFVPARMGEQRQSSWVEFPVRFASSS